MRPQEGDYSIGHEYWFEDGVHIGYHGRPRDESGRHVFGHIRWDNEEWVEDHFPFHSTHFHSLEETLIVGDGTAASVFTSESKARPYIQLFERRTVAGDGERYVEPKILAYHLGKAEQFWLFRARSIISTRTAAHQSVRCALRLMGRRCCIRRI